MKPPTPPNTEKITKKPDRQEGGKLDDRFGGDSHDQAFLMLGGVDVASAEQNGEGGHQERDDQCRIDGRCNSCSWRAPSSAVTERATALSCSAM